ncbi:MAG TPA: hypothetical protein VGM12_32590 [Trebonia sp.]
MEFQHHRQPAGGDQRPPVADSADENAIVAEFARVYQSAISARWSPC